MIPEKTIKLINKITEYFKVHDSMLEFRVENNEKWIEIYCDLHYSNTFVYNAMKYAEVNIRTYNLNNRICCVFEMLLDDYINMGKKLAIIHDDDKENIIDSIVDVINKIDGVSSSLCYNIEYGDHFRIKIDKSFKTSEVIQKLADNIYDWENVTIYKYTNSIEIDFEKDDEFVAFCKDYFKLENEVC